MFFNFSEIKNIYNNLLRCATLPIVVQYFPSSDATIISKNQKYTSNSFSFQFMRQKKPFYNTSREKISPLKIKDSLFVPIKAAKLQTDEDFPTAIAKSAIKHCTFDLLNQGCFRKHQWGKGRQGKTTPKRAIGGDVTQSVRPHTRPLVQWGPILGSP